MSQADLNKLIKQIEGYARGFGLDFFPVIFEMVDFEQMNEVASFGGFPVRYPHWRFGMQYRYMKKSYSYGLHKIYEMVINNNPCYAYLLDSNNLVDQKLVIAHVYGHCDFFKNNAYFSSTNRRMVDEMANHGMRVQKYISRYGLEVVEDFLDVCFSIENLIDPNAIFSKHLHLDNGNGNGRNQGNGNINGDSSGHDEEEPDKPIPKLKSKGYMESFINPPEYLKKRREELELAKQQQVRFPRQPEKDIMMFLIDYAPLPNWKRDMLSMIREESYYFAPQGQTKIMNEGWAVYWHSKIMTRKSLTDAELIDYADHHSGTLGVRPGVINPYKLGLELYKDIERRWDTGRFGKDYEECEDLTKKETWNLDTGQGREKIFQVRKIYNDMMFIDDFLTEEFCREHQLFSYQFNPKTNMYEIAERSLEAIKEKLLFNLTNLGHPYVTVTDANYENRGELYLKHRFDGVELRLDFAKATLENLFKVWTRPVHIETIIGEDYTLLSFDGTAHSDKKITEKSTA